MKRSDLRQVKIDADFDIPRTTAQQRRFAAGQNYAGPLLKRAKATWRALARANAPERPLEGALEVAVCLFYKAQVSGTQYKTTRPDLDNTVKPVLDALAKEGWFRDDAQVAILRMCKAKWPWHDHVIIEVKEIDNEANS